MNRRRLALVALAAPIAGLSAMAARAQGYPERPITFLTPFAGGNAADVLVRAIASEISRLSGQPVVVDSRPGAGTLLAAQAAAKAPADGYTVFATGITTFGANRHLFRKLPYDPVRDFAMVTALAKGVNVLFAHPTNVPARSIAELVAYARANPGKLTIGDATPTTRAQAELLQRGGGFKLTRVPYRASTQALPDLIGGRLDLLFTDATALRFARDGRLRALAVTDTERSPLAPDLPTLREAGVKDVDIGFYLEAVVPARTPSVVIERLRKLLRAAAQAAPLQRTYAENGMQPLLGTGQELQALNDAEAARWGVLVKTLDLEIQ